jgi:methionine-rich copper-binding protein CopC
MDVVSMLRKFSVIVIVMLFVLTSCSGVHGTANVPVPAVPKNQQAAPGPTTTQLTTSQPVNEPASPSKLANPLPKNY